MPQNINPAVATLVMPKLLSTAFSEAQNLDVLSNRYVDGSVQLIALTTAVRRSWRMTVKMTASQTASLYSFWKTVNGGSAPFYFYNLVEGVWDGTGVLTAGRYVVVFTSDFSATYGILRIDHSLGLLEVA